MKSFTRNTHGEVTQGENDFTVYKYLNMSNMFL